MFSSQWPPGVAAALKLATLATGLAAALVAWRAAGLWLAASKVRIEDTTPRTMVSYDDNPALGILEAIVSANAIQAAYEESARTNARAARWTALAAILTGVTMVLGAL